MSRTARAVCEGERADSPTWYANINKPAVTSASSGFLSLNLSLLWKPVYWHTFTHGCKSYVRARYTKRTNCRIKFFYKTKQTDARTHACTHLVSFRMPGILCLLGSHYFLSPHADCCTTADKICHSAQYLICSTCNWKNAVWWVIEVKLNLQESSESGWVSSGRLLRTQVL